MTMKNWYGLLGGRRNIFHQDINTIIAELAMMVKPTLVILDGTQIMMTNGPTGGSIASDRLRSNLDGYVRYVAELLERGARAGEFREIEPTSAAREPGSRLLLGQCDALLHRDAHVHRVPVVLVVEVF